MAMAPAAVTTAGNTRAGRPNILLIVADDLGWADVGYHGSDLLTPNLDREVKRAVELDCHYVAPVCSPTRAGLLSGRYCSRFGVTTPTNSQAYPFGTVTLASALQSVGYDTCITGKWHLGSLPECGPKCFGFNRSHGAFAGGVGPYNHLYKPGRFSRTWHRNDQHIEEEGHVTDLIGREAVRFIEAERDSPFFVYVPFTAVHTPIDEPSKWLERNRHIPEARRQYAGSTTHMDHWFGEMIGALERTGQRQNTLVLFFSDNGGTTSSDSANYPGAYPPNEELGSNLPLRGGKGQVYEGGIRTPALVRWPGVLEPRKLGTPLSVTDWMPTFCRLAGYRPDADLRWDGIDIWAVLRDPGTTPAPRIIYSPGPRWRHNAVRSGDWKLITFHEDDGSEKRCLLFNLADDPCEKRDLAEEEPDRVRELRRLLLAHRSRDNDAVVKA